MAYRHAHQTPCVQYATVPAHLPTRSAEYSTYLYAPILSANFPWPERAMDGCKTCRAGCFWLLAALAYPVWATDTGLFGEGRIGSDRSLTRSGTHTLSHMNTHSLSPRQTHNLYCSSFSLSITHPHPHTHAHPPFLSFLPPPLILGHPYLPVSHSDRVVVHSALSLS